MRYMMLIYSKELPEGLSGEERHELYAGHARTMQEATRKGVLRGAEPLSPTTTATTVRMQNGKALVTKSFAAACLLEHRQTAHSA